MRATRSRTNFCHERNLRDSRDSFVRALRRSVSLVPIFDCAVFVDAFLGCLLLDSKERNRRSRRRARRR